MIVGEKEREWGNWRKRKMKIDIEQNIRGGNKEQIWERRWKKKEQFEKNPEENERKIREKKK